MEICGLACTDNVFIDGPMKGGGGGGKGGFAPSSQKQGEEGNKRGKQKGNLQKYDFFPIYLAFI